MYLLVYSSSRSNENFTKLVSGCSSYKKKKNRNPNSNPIQSRKILLTGVFFWQTCCNHFYMCLSKLSGSHHSSLFACGMFKLTCTQTSPQQFARPSENPSDRKIRQAQKVFQILRMYNLDQVPAGCPGSVQVVVIAKAFVLVVPIGGHWDTLSSMSGTEE